MYRGERFNSISHLVGACLALVGTVALVVLASLHGDALKIVSLSIYGASLLTLYTSSTLYHSLQGRAKRVFRHLDHTAIYLLIAGSYTPLTLVVLRGRLGWWLFAAVWTLAAIGAVQEFRKVKGERMLSVVIYVTMGWLAVVALGPLARASEPLGWRGFSLAAFSTPTVSCSTPSTVGCRCFTASGTCSCWAAAWPTTSSSSPMPPDWSEPLACRNIGRLNGQLGPFWRKVGSANSRAPSDRPSSSFSECFVVFEVGGLPRRVNC